MTKTPYEIRMDLLQMAQAQLQAEYYARLEQAREIQNAEWREAAIRELKYPIKEDIVFLAEKLKTFIETK